MIFYTQYPRIFSRLDNHLYFLSAVFLKKSFPGFIEPNMDQENEGVCKIAGQGIERAVHFLHDLPEMRQKIRQELCRAVCQDLIPAVSLTGTFFRYSID